MSKPTIKVAEMFAGVGGFHLGLTRTSKQFEVVWANQFEPTRKKQFAFNIYQKNFPNTPASNEDITKLDKNQIPEMDLLVGGFPCQDYSVAKAGAEGLYGKKGVLWWDILDVARLKSPRYIFLENVDRLLASPGVSSNQPGRDFGMILRTLSDIGYGVSWKMINAAEYGYPQRRRRTFIFAFREDTEFNKELSNLNKTEKEIKKFISQMPPFSSTMSNESIHDYHTVNLNEIEDLKEFSDNFKLTKGFKKTGFMFQGKVYMAHYKPKVRKEATLRNLVIPNIENEALYLSPEKIKKFKELKSGFRTVKISRTGHPYKYGMGEVSFPDSLDKPARTMVTSESTTSRMSHVIKDPGNDRLRLLAPEEAELINTFPKNWTELEGVTDANRYFTMGNALVVDLVKEIGEEILKIMNSDSSSINRIQHKSIERISH